MNIISILILIFGVMTLLVGNQMYQSDLEYDNLRDIENLTSQINWDFNYTLIEPSNKEDIITSRVHNIIYKFVDFLGYTFIETTKTGVEFGYNNPQYDYELGLGLLKLLIIAMIIGFLVPLFIQLLAIITIIRIGIISLFKKLNQWNLKRLAKDIIKKRINTPYRIDKK